MNKTSISFPRPLAHVERENFNIEFIWNFKFNHKVKSTNQHHSRSNKSSIDQIESETIARLCGTNDRYDVPDS